MIKTFIYEDMEKLINDNKASVLKTSQRQNKNNIHRKLVKYNDKQYLLCNHCNKYLELACFGSRKHGFVNKTYVCKKCDTIDHNNRYHNNLLQHLYLRYKSIVTNSIKHKVPYLTYKEFIYFAKTVQEPIYKLTLEDAFYKNIAGNFQIEHKKPISRGGTSLTSNLFLSYKPFNSLKGTMTVIETIEFAKLIVKNEDAIKKSYNIR